MTVVSGANQGGLERQELSGQERQALKRAYERSLEDTRSEDTETLLEKIREYSSEIEVAAEVAKAQTSKGFGGTMPQSDNEFALTRIDSAYFAMDDWDVQFAAGNSLTAGATANWIHEDMDVDTAATTLGGVAGNGVTIGQDVVHLILGVGSYHPSPKITRVKFTLNDVPRTVLPVSEEFRSMDMQIKWLDAPVLLSGEDDFLAEVYAGIGGEDVPYLEGVSFIANQEARQLDPANLRDTSGTNTEEVVSQ